MALTRKYLKSLNLTDDQIEGIIEEHTATVDGLKEQINRYKPDAEKLSAVEKELSDLKAAGDGGFKEKYEAEKKAHADYKADVEKRELKGKKRAAFYNVLKKAGITRDVFQKLIADGFDIDALELENDAIKDADALADRIKTDYSDLVSVETEKGLSSITPPIGGGGMTKEQILKVKDTAERQKLIGENLSLFRK